MDELLDSVVRGIPFGCVFGLLAMGLVLVYRTTGVFNLAFGAQAFVSAAVYYDLRVRHAWEILPAFTVAVLVVAPLLGLVLDLAFFRHLRSATPVSRLVVALGLLVALPEAVKLWFGSGPAFAPPSLSPDPDRLWRIGDLTVDGNDVVTIAVTVAMVALLTVLFRFTPLGLRMRAVVESPRMTELMGVAADRVTATAWTLSSLLAGLVGVLLAPLFAQVNASSFTTLLIVAIAAAAVGGFVSIPWAFLGGLGLGVAQQMISAQLPLDSVLAAGLRPALPFFVLFVLLVLRAGRHVDRPPTDPLSTVEPPGSGGSLAVRSEPTTRAGRALTATAAAGLVLGAVVLLDPFWLSLTTEAVLFAVVFLSITVITGMAGQLSLCQATFAAIGAFTTAQLADAFGLPVLVAVLGGALLAAAVGALLALPALHLGGIQLAFATLAFALMFTSIVEPLDWVSGGALPVDVPRPAIGPVELTDDRWFLLLAVGVLAVVGFGLLRVRDGRLGRSLRALSTSEAAARSVGIGPLRPRVTALALSAAVAGLGGGLLAVGQGEANPATFTPLLGLFWVVIVVVLGTRSVTGAVVAGFALVVLPEVFDRVGLSTSWLFVLFGLAALSFARHPGGLVEATVGWLRDRFGPAGEDTGPPRVGAGEVRA